MKKWPITVVWLCLASAFFAAAPIEQTNAAVRFKVFDIYLDSDQEILAAYQLEWTDESGKAKIVGVEGGDYAAFKVPPYYDPKAMQQERVILAAFSTAGAELLPHGKTRVATIHVQLSGDAALDPLVKNARGATPSGKKITVNATCLEREVKFE